MTNGNAVVVIGGGIGGLSAAIALTRQGCDVTLLERAPEFGEVGAGLQIAPNAGRVLAEWGLLDEALSAGVQPSNLVFTDAMTGDELTRLPLGEDFRSRYGAPYFVVHRSDLHRILVDACRRLGVDLRTGHDVTSIGTDEGQAVTVCADGLQIRSDAAVAADGLDSSARDHIVADAPVPSGYVAYRGTIPISEVPEMSALDNVVAHLGPGCHFVQYRLRGGEMLNQVAVFQSPSFLAGNLDWGGPEELDQAFGACSENIRESLRYLWRDRWWRMADRNPTESWVDGRVVLLGDAAHPPLQYLAQGACMAIEDAACLGDAVASQVHQEDWDAVLEKYRRVRAPRTARIQTTARTWGDIWHVDGVGRLLRNEVFRQRDHADYRYVDWLYGPDACARQAG